MSILIKGMEMPNACCDCNLLPEEIDRNEQWECPITEKIVNKYVEERKGKPSDCPLVEVLGRLIDVDKIFNALRISKDIDDESKAKFIGLLIESPTVMEAEEQEE